MLKNQFSIIFFIILSVGFVKANEHSQNYQCTEWAVQNGVSCVVAGNNATIYARQCENPCWRSPNGNGNWGPNCDMEKICSIRHPDSFDNKCSEWLPERSSSCYNPNTNNWEQKWVRTCTVGLREHWCSDTDPN